MPTRLISSVRGIGVADIVSTSTLVFSFLIDSLCWTPKRCSSSTTSSPRSLNFRPSASRRWVPITQIDLAGREAVDHLPGLTGGEEAGEHLDPDRVAGEPVGEGVAVLLGEQRRRHQHGDLLAVLDRLERGADGDLGLAEPDVAAHQAVHRVRRSPCRPSPRRSRCAGRASRRTGTPPPSRAATGCPAAKAWPGRVHAASGRARPVPGRSRARRSGPATWPWRSRRPPRRCSDGASPPTYWRIASIWSDGT